VGVFLRGVASAALPNCERQLLFLVHESVPATCLARS
jgi:hypothetical protein